MKSFHLKSLIHIDFIENQIGGTRPKSDGSKQNYNLFFDWFNIIKKPPKHH